MNGVKIYIKTAFKFFVSSAIPLMGIFMIYKLMFEISIDWSFLIVFIPIISIVSAQHYMQTVDEITIENENDFIKTIKEELNNIPWEIISETKEKIVLKPKFDTPYSWIYKERVIVDITENKVKLTGAKLYVNKLKSVIEGERSTVGKKILKYLANLVLIIIILMPIFFNIGIINRIKINYHEFKIKDIEKIEVEKNFTLGNTVENINSYGGVAESEDYYFYVKNHLQLCRSDKNFENEITLIDKPGGSGMSYLNVVDDWIFYNSGKSFNRIKIDGSKQETIYNLGYLLDIHILDNWIYYINHSDNSKIYKMDLNGQNLHSINDITVEDISIYDSRIYYSYEKDGESYFESMNLNGKDKQFVANIFPFDLVKDEDIIYYINDKDFKLYKYNLKTKEKPQKLINEEISRFTKAGNWIYFSGKGERVYYPGTNLFKIDINGNARQKISEDNDIEHLSNFGEWILFSSRRDNKLPYLKRFNIEDHVIIDMN